MKSVTILFTRQDSIYKQMPDCDVYDIERNALTFPGGMPVVAHPPCRSWGSLRGLAKPLPGEKELAIWAVDQVRKWGGVLEHPAASQLWPVMGLPKGTGRDNFGGFSLHIDQSWFGHRAQKKTLLYICGVEPVDIPAYPVRFDVVTHVVTNRKGIRAGHPRFKSEISKAEREHTPKQLAEWLVELAKKCKR
jgi:hypothetical protein